MGAKHEDTNIQCPYCCNHTQKREGFSRIQNLMGSEWVIYRPNDHTENDAPAGQAGRSKNTLGNVFVLYNRKNKQMVTADLFFQLNKQTIPCQRCRIKNEHAHTLILCDHCLLKTEIENPCHKCENIINNFLSTRGEATSPINKYFKLWLTKMEHKLNKSICEIKPQKILQRSYSDINNYVPKQEKFKTVKCRIKQMFHSEVNLTATSRKKEGIEKSVHFTGYVDFFQSSESYIDDADKLAFKHSQSSEEAKSSKSIIAKSLMNHLGRENFMEKQQNLIGSALEKDSSFIFPQDTLKSDIILSRYVSSSELIKDIQEKIQFKVAEEENKIRESHRREIEAENTKGLTDDDNKMLINIEEHKQEIPAKLKPRDLSPKAEKSKYFEQQIQESEKHSGLSEEKTSEKSRPILAEANKSTKGSTKQLESEDVSEKVIKDKNKSVNERNQEEHFKDKMIERDKENLGKINKTLKSRKTFEGKIFPHLKDIHKLRKPKNSEDQNEKEMPTSDTRKSGKIKNIESEKSQDVKHRKPDAIDVMSDLTRKKGLSKLSATHDNLEKQKLSKTKKVQDLNEKEMPISDARQLDKTKNMLSEKMQDIKKVTKPDAMDIISQLTRKKGPPNLSSSDDNLEKQKLSKTKKVEDLNEKDTKQLDKINNIEFEKTQDIKKVRKPDTMDIISELTRKKEGKIKFTSNDDNLDNKRETALQSVDKNNSKKANNVKESKENEKKLNQIKIQKIDDDDVISKLIKSNASDVGKKKEQLTVTGKSEMVDVLEGLNIKLLEVSKLQLEATKVKEKLAEKLNSVPETKKKEDKSVLPSKEKQEKELKFNEVKLVDNNFDNLILRLINIRATEKTGHVPKVESFQIKTKYRQHMDKQNLELEDKPISESDILECSANEQPIQKAIDYGLGIKT